MYRRMALLAAALVAVAGVSGAAAKPVAKKATQSKAFKLGLYDEAQTLYGDPDATFAQLEQLNTKLIRANLYWGGRFGVANRKPARAADHEDPAYNWELYDRLVRYAHASGIDVVFSIWSTPRWANGRANVRFAPKRFADLQNFARAAANRYNGRNFDADGNRLARVNYWLAWNEPNNPSFLLPQYVKVKGKWRAESARNYAKICNAIYAGVKAGSRAKVACGVTAPRGNNIPGRARPSIAPIAFLRAAKGFGMRRFDAYAHHPYYGRKTETPTSAPAPTAVTLANIGVLTRELTRLWGAKRVWITEYGYQTNPPDRAFGVSYAKQATYLRQAYAIARRHPRIDMMLWFLLRDEPNLAGWQSGLLTRTGQRKPAFYAVRALPR